MGVISGVKDAIMGKDYKQNTVLGEVTVLLFERAKNANHPFVEEWVSECTVTAYSILEILLFDHHPEGAKAFAQFRARQHAVDPPRALALFRLIASDFLLAFNNEVNDADFELATGMTTEEFGHEVCDVFDFGPADRRLHAELGGLFSRETYTEFSTKLYRSALSLVCGLEARPKTMGLIAFTQLVATTYNSFARQFLVRQSH